MTKKRLITTMSNKKRDIMLSAAAAGVNPSPQNTRTKGIPLVISPLTGNAANTNTHLCAFIPSYRGLVPNNYSYLAARTSTRTWVKGISETYSITPSDASAWWWRRIVISYKGDWNTTLPVMFQNIGAQLSTGGTTYRSFVDLTGDSSGSFTDFWDQINEVLFQGVKSTDWLDPMLAKVDNQRVTLISDKTRVISTANDSPRPRIIRTYVPVHKTIQYDDEENGTSVTPSFMSTQNKTGIGNLYVFDLFNCRAPISNISSQLQVSSTMTYYWHEK